MLMKKTLLLIAAVFISATSFAQEVTFDFNNALSMFGFTTASTNDTHDADFTEAKTTTSEGISLTISPSTTSTPNRVWGSAPQLRLYGGTLTISANETISKIVFNLNPTAKSAKWGTANTVNTGELSEYVEKTSTSVTWTGSSKEIILTVAKNTQLCSIVVTLGEGTPEIPGEGGEGETEEPETPAAISVAEALAATANTNVCVNAQAVALSTSGAVLADATGFIYYYGTPDFKVGDAVNVVGPVTAYGGFNQFSGSTATVTVGENTAVTYPQPTEIDDAALDAWIANPVHQYITITGKLTISNNKYYNIAVEGATTGIGSLVSPTAELLEGVADGNNITVTGYAVYVNSSKYINIVATNIKVNEDTEGGTEEPDTPDTPETGSEVTFDFNNALSMFGFTTASTSDTHDADFTETKTYTDNGVSLSVSPSTNSTPNRVWGSAPQLRLYGGTLTISANETISKIVFNLNPTAKSAKWGAANTVNTGELSEYVEKTSTSVTWTGSSKEIILTVAKNTQFCSIVVTLGEAEEGGEPEEPEEPETPAAITVAEALAATTNTNVCVNAQVVAINTSGAVFADATGFIYYYGTPDFKVGDAVNVVGPVTVYNGFNQFSGSTATVTVGENTAVTHPAPVEIDDAGLDAWIANPVHQYVTLTGIISIGSYYNVTIEGATGQGSIVKPTAELLEGITNGSNITVTGYAVYASNGKYMNIVATDIKANTVVELKDPSNTAETAYTVAQAKALIDAADEYDLTKEVFVKGIVSEIDEISLQFGNATFNIEDGFKIYRCKDFGGENITKEDLFKVNDEVVVKGTLTLYYETYQLINGQLQTINNVATGVNSIKAAAEGKAYDLTGRVANKNAKGIVIVNGKKVVK